MSEYADQYNYLFFSFASLLSSSFPFFPSPFSFLFFSSSRKKYTPFTECTFLPFDPNAHGIVHSAPWRVQLAGNRLTTRKSIKLRISLKEFASAAGLSPFLFFYDPHTHGKKIRSLYRRIVSELFFFGNNSLSTFQRSTLRGKYLSREEFFSSLSSFLMLGKGKKGEKKKKKKKKKKGNAISRNRQP